MTITTIPARTALEADCVTLSGYFYAVDLGPDVRPQHHRVGINGACTCPLGTDCPAVRLVRRCLEAGGQRAERPPFGYYPVAPARCPICSQPVVFDPSLSSPHRGAGWRCSAGGKSHYWSQRARISSARRSSGKAA
jgi:hypothetical protein